MQARDRRKVPEQVHPAGRQPDLRSQHAFQLAGDLPVGMHRGLLFQLAPVQKGQGGIQARRPLHELQERLPGHPERCRLRSHAGRAQEVDRGQPFEVRAQGRAAANADETNPGLRSQDLPLDQLGLVVHQRAHDLLVRLSRRWRLDDLLPLHFCRRQKAGLFRGGHRPPPGGCKERSPNDWKAYRSDQGRRCLLRRSVKQFVSIFETMSMSFFRVLRGPVQDDRCQGQGCFVCRRSHLWRRPQVQEVTRLADLPGRA